MTDWKTRALKAEKDFEELNKQFRRHKEKLKKASEKLEQVKVDLANWFDHCEWDDPNVNRVQLEIEDIMNKHFPEIYTFNIDREVVE